MMTEPATLIEKIRSLGGEVLRLKNKDELVLFASRAETSFDQLAADFDSLYMKCRSFSQLARLASVRKNLAGSQKREAEPGADLALRVLSQDLRNAMTGFSVQRLRMGRYPEQAHMIAQDKKRLLDYENSRLGLLLIAYLATGENVFLAQSRAADVPELLSHLGTTMPQAHYSFCGIGHIGTDEYFALFQLLKNSGRNYAEAGVTEPVIVAVQDEGPSRVVSVTDSGTGIPPEVLNRLFNGFSTRPGSDGTGLRIVKKILDLRNGHAEVTSTTSHKGTYGLDTRNLGNIHEVAEKRNPGTTFTLYLPRQ